MREIIYNLFYFTKNEVIDAIAISAHEFNGTDEEKDEVDPDLRPGDG